jgi:DNA-3-methyladenine glycosylase I
MIDGIAVGDDGLARCWWASGDTLRAYHDVEWGRPVADDRRLFEKLCLEGFQSGLSWLTILNKRPAFRRAFGDFEPAVIAAFDETDVERLMADTGIVRNRAKIEATVNNARRYPDLVQEFGSLAAYLWSYEPTPEARPASMDQATLMTLAVSPESTAMSKDLRKRGWAFVGPTTAYAAMEAMGIVNDHLDVCHVRATVESAREAFERPRPASR